jgi:endonuclease YncB( thermonuclease family)
VTSNQRAPVPAGHVQIDGETTAVTWLDGDTFKLHDPGSDEPVRARLEGFNTLESYGPVHRWGEWSAAELERFAKSAGYFAESRGWRCEDTGRSGGYGRKLVRCPALARALLERGYAHVFALDGPAPPEWLAWQRAAQAARRGIWKRGVPELIVTSLHSVDERPRATQAYDRVVETRTGRARKVVHDRRHEPCQWICHGGSCMIYVPFARRYGSKRLTCPEPP